MIDREKQLYLWANPKQTIGEGFIHFEFGICSPTGSTTGDTSGVTVDLNNQWVESTRKLDGYLVFMSNSNKGVANGYASMKFKFKGEPDFKIWIHSSAEYYNDYTIAFNMDVDYPTTLPSSGSKGVKDHTQYSFSFGSPTSIDEFTEVDYPNDGGEHFVVVTYRKNYDGDEYDDRGYVAIKAKPLSTSWVLSSTEFVKENDKYYQRINEVGTYEEGATALTGNFKAGDELTPTYIQSSNADDYMVVGSGMYYKKYAYVTPVDTAINTGDYIQGDYIGEYKPTVVTYKDGTTKEFDDMRIFPDMYAKEVSGATKVELGSTVERLQESFSSYNQNLTALTFSDRITTIYFRQCEGCKNLAYVKIGSGVNLINEEAFQDCHNLSSVTIKNSSNKLVYNESAFYGISSTAKLYVPSNLLADYQADTDWTGAFPGGIYAIE